MASAMHTGLAPSLWVREPPMYSIDRLVIGPAQGPPCVLQQDPKLTATSGKIFRICSVFKCKYKPIETAMLVVHAPY